MQFFQKVEGWLDECQSKDKPTDTGRIEEVLAKHQLLKESCDHLHSTVQQQGKKIVEKLRMPVGDSSLPTGFVMGTRHVKEILESLYDEKSWIEEQWGKRQALLTKALNLCKFQDKAKKVSRISQSYSLRCIPNTACMANIQYVICDKYCSNQFKAYCIHM